MSFRIRESRCPVFAKAACAALLAVLGTPQGIASGRARSLDPNEPFFGAKFEPHGIYHIVEGETQARVTWDCSSFPTRPCSTVGTVVKYGRAAGRMPIGVMQYIYKNDHIPGAKFPFGVVGRDVKRTFKKKGYIPQIGVPFWPDGDLQRDDTGAIVSGVYDAFFRDLARLLARSEVPVFVRPGFEFGGSGAGRIYNRTNYVAAFRRMVDIFRQEGVKNVAFVWDQYNETEYMFWYPGDSYVDWWGINLFDKSGMISTLTVSFMNDALAHRKPVMIGESSPKRIGVSPADTAWNEWFAPFFDFIARWEHVRAFSYINSSWRGISGFLDSRIELEPALASQYASRVSDPVFLHHPDYGGAGVTFGPAISIQQGSEVTASGITSTAATVTWTTEAVLNGQNGRTTSQVEYGTSTAYGSQTVEDRSYVNSHSALLHGLTPGTRYHFRVRGFDKSGFEIRSGDFTFTTPP